MTRKSGPRRLDHWLAGSDRSPKATGDHHDTFSAAPSRQHLRYGRPDRLTTVRFRSRRHRRWPPSNAGRLGAELSAAEGSMAGGGGDSEPVGHLAGRGGRPVSESALRESRGQLRPARHRTTPRRRRRNRSTRPYLRQPHRSACPIRRRGRRTAPRVRRGGRGHRRGGAYNQRLPSYGA